MDTLPTITQTIRQFGLESKKSLGQHFLTDASLLEKIVRYAGNLSNQEVVEIGPGPGGMTRALLASAAKHVYVVEKDGRCIAALAALRALYPDRLSILEADALKTGLAEIAGGRKLHVVANLPYNIASKLLVNWLEQLDHITAMTLMFQKEVAARISAKPGNKSYGRLSVISQWLCTVDTCFDIAPQAFTPPPKVVSTVLSLVPRPEPLYPASKQSLERLCRAVFGQRRKTLKVSLKQITEEAGKALALAEIDPMLRPEALDIDQFCRLSRALDSL